MTILNDSHRRGTKISTECSTEKTNSSFRFYVYQKNWPSGTFSVTEKICSTDGTAILKNYACVKNSSFEAFLII
jgi:hypothetical protein